MVGWREASNPGEKAAGAGRPLRGRREALGHRRGEDLEKAVGLGEGRVWILGRRQGLRVETESLGEESGRQGVDLSG